VKKAVLVEQIKSGNRGLVGNLKLLLQNLVKPVKKLRIICNSENQSLSILNTRYGALQLHEGVLK
jgi:hypothetical protein